MCVAGFLSVSTVLRHLNAALNEAVDDYYVRFRQQQPARQTLAYVQYVNADLQHAIACLQSRQMQAAARCHVWDADTQTQPIHFARA